MLISCIGSITQCREYISCYKLVLPDSLFLAFYLCKIVMIKNLGNQFTLYNLKIVLISQKLSLHCECYASSSKQNLHDVWFNCSLRYYCHFCPMDYVQLYKDDGIGGDRGSYASRPLEFVRSVNPISTIRVDYALHISSYPHIFTCPLPSTFSDLPPSLL